MSPTFVMASNGRFHSLSLASALDRQRRLVRLFTVFYSQKDRLISRWVRREDKEQITLSRVRTNAWTELPLRIVPHVPGGDRYAEYLKAIWLDRWVARELASESADVFIGWSNSSLESLRVARDRGMRTVLTRGSSHIQYQTEILAAEYAKRGLAYRPPYGIEARELAEYRLADYIRIPSSYVKQTFVDRGIAVSKLLLFPHAVDLTHFHPQAREASGRFRVLLLNALTVQKGFYYAQEAIEAIRGRGVKDIEFWLIGRAEPAIQSALTRLLTKEGNVKAFGRVNHYDLARWISQCDVGVFPTVQEGFANTVPQTMACGVPVIATTNSGAADVVDEGREGFIVPIMDAPALADRIVWCYEHRDACQEMGRAAAARARRRTWDDVVVEMVGALEAPAA